MKHFLARYACGSVLLKTSPETLSCLVESSSAFNGAAARHRAERRRCESAFRIENFTRSGFPFSRSLVEDSQRRRVARCDVSSTTDLPSHATVRQLEECFDRRQKWACSSVPGDDVRHGLSTMDLSTGVGVSVSKACRSRTSQRRWQLWQSRRYEICTL